MHFPVMQSCTLTAHPILPTPPYCPSAERHYSHHSCLVRLVAESPYGVISEVILRFDEWKIILSEDESLTLVFDFSCFPTHDLLGTIIFVDLSHLCDSGRIHSIAGIAEPRSFNPIAGSSQPPQPVCLLSLTILWYFPASLCHLLQLLKAYRALERAVLVNLQ